MIKMEQTSFTERLMEFGLTRQEASIYQCLLTEGKVTGYEVAKQTGISRSNAYNSLASMTEKGAAYLVEEASTRKYVPVPLNEFCKNNNLPFYGIHCFRHLFASLLVNQGVDIVTVSGALGHSAVSTTVNLAKGRNPKISHIRQRALPQKSGNASICRKLQRKLGFLRKCGIIYNGGEKC